MAVADYKNLIVWKKSMDLVVEIYNLVKKLPKEETFALSSQMRRAVVSIPSNIAEGYSRNSEKQFAQFLSISKGSASELETQLLICMRLDYLKESQVINALNLCDEVCRMINKLIKIKIKE